jgi:hypothetical protein
MFCWYFCWYIAVQQPQKTVVFIGETVFDVIPVGAIESTIPSAKCYQFE